MYAVTGATGALGRLVIADLLKKVPASEVVVLVRNVEKATNLAALGVHVRTFDYAKAETLAPALQGVTKLLLISSSELGQRFVQHKAVIDAAQSVGMPFIIYTSLLNAASSKLDLAEEHHQTEVYLASSGIAYAVLRNGWYTENYTASIAPALAHGAFIGSVGDGKISSTARADYAAAAVAVLTSAAPQEGKIYELAGDTAYTLAEFAAELSSQSGKTVPYVYLPRADYKGALVGAGLPEPVAELLSQSDDAASHGALFDDSHTLSALIGRPTTPLKDVIAAALKG